MRHLYILTILFPAVVFGKTAFSQSDSLKLITGQWTLYPNTQWDTMTFVHSDSVQGLQLNPIKQWTFTSDGQLKTEDYFSNYHTTNGIIDGKDPKDTSWLEIKIVNGDTTTQFHGVRQPNKISGATIFQMTWKISNGNILTLTTTGDNPTYEKYKIIALTNRRLKIIKLK